MLHLQKRDCRVREDSQLVIFAIGEYSGVLARH